MSFTIADLNKSKFSKEAIDNQLQKIVHDPHFEDSKILTRFLSFVVEETLNERTNTLKEYTIAVRVLEKPPNFNTHESGIVRIHAGRLRRALNYYYEHKGLLDQIRISIPKGSYVPVFDENDDIPRLQITTSKKKTIVCVAPFRCSISDNCMNNFAEGLNMQLNVALMQLDNFSVVASYVMKELVSKNASLEQIAIATGGQFLITGDIQEMKGLLRIYAQMIRIKTSLIVWSHMYEKKVSSENIFDAQDEIVQLAISELEELAF